MSECPQVKTCPLFPVFTMQSALKVWQTNYCESDYERCARYQRAQEGRESPINLLPNGTKLAVLAKRA